MISEQFELLIAQGKAKEIIYNIGNSVNTFKIGKGKSIILHHLQIHPHQVELTSNNTDILTAMNVIADGANIYTLSARAKNNSFNYTYKNKWSISAFGANGTSLPGIAATSLMDYKQDLFQVFNDPNLIIEISEGSKMGTPAKTNGNAPFPNNEGNPQGFINPVIVEYSYTNHIVQQSGSYSGVGAGFTYYDFVVPKIGNGIAGNTIDKKPLITPFFQPLITLFLIEIDTDLLKNLK